MGTINENIKKARAASKLTLEEVAEKVGVSRQTIQKYESGVISNIPSERIEAIAKALSVSPAYLMGWITDDGESIIDYYYDTINNLLVFLKDSGYTLLETNTASYLVLDSLGQEIKFISESSLIKNYEMSKIDAKPITASSVLGLDSSTLDSKPQVHTIAAHHDGEEWTEAELDEIEQFKKYVLSKRK